MSDVKDYAKGRVLVPYRIGMQSDGSYRGIGLVWGNGDYLTDDEADYVIDCVRSCRGQDPQEMRHLAICDELWQNALGWHEVSHSCYAKNGQTSHTVELSCSGITFLGMGATAAEARCRAAISAGIKWRGKKLTEEDLK